MIATPTSHPHCGAPVTTRQQILILYLSHSDLSASVTGWAFHDGSTAQTKSLEEVPDYPPYHSGLDALRDGWRLIHWPILTPHTDGGFDLSYLPNEFVFEKVQGVDAC